MLKKEIKQKTKQRKKSSPESERKRLNDEVNSAKKALHEIERRLFASLSDKPNNSSLDPVPDYKYQFHISEADAEGWHKFIQGQSSSLYHSWRWRSIFADTMRRETKYLAARDSESNTIGVLPIAITHSTIFGHYGVSLPYVNYGSAVAIANNVEEALIQYAFDEASAWGLSRIEVRDVKSRSFPSERTDKVCMVLELADYKNYQELSAILGAKVRSQTNKALSSGIQFRMGGLELVNDFYQVFAHNMRDLGTPVYSKSLFSTILEIFPEDVLLVCGYLSHKPVSCAFLIKQNADWEIPWASTLRSANRIGANMALYATVLRTVLERGATNFDFGRSTIDSPTYQFKKQWKALPRQLYWYYSSFDHIAELSPTNTKYRKAIQVWQKLPLGVANFIGPHIVKNLP